MADLPLRNLGRIGLVKDVEPFDLPPNAWSGADNVRFVNGRVERSPIFKTVGSLSKEPGFATTIPQDAGDDFIHLGNVDGSITRWQGTVESDVTYAGWSSAPSEALWTSTYLGDIHYMNRASEVPHYISGADVQYQDLPGWDPSWRCEALSSYKDFLIALNVTKGGIGNRYMVKWSDVAISGAPPQSWDHTDPTISAGENILNTTTPLVDGLTLGRNFFIYSSTDVWQMSFVGGRFIFRFDKAPFDAGVINANCIVEVEGFHYVFGLTDIYRHNGGQMQSLAQGRMRNFIFENINYETTNLCFVRHNQTLKEIMFAFPSGDPDARWDADGGCNRAAVYNYRFDTWSLVDLPNVTGATYARQTGVSVSYDSTTLTYDQIGASYNNIAEGAPRNLFMPSRAPLSGSAGVRAVPSTNAVLGYDFPTKGNLNFPSADQLNPPARITRVDFPISDQAGFPDQTYVNVTRIRPRAKLQLPADAASGSQELLEFAWAGHEFTDQATDNLTALFEEVDPRSQSTADRRDGGVYLDFRVAHQGPVTGVDPGGNPNAWKPGDFQLTSMVLEYFLAGKRPPGT